MSRDERGQATVLIVGFAVVAVMLVAVVVDASAAYLRQAELSTLADGAALAAADGVRGAQVYEGGLDGRARIDPLLARRRAAAYLRSSGAFRRFPGLRYRVEASPDRVVVRVRTALDLPLTPPGWAHRPDVSAVAAAVVEVSD